MLFFETFSLCIFKNILLYFILGNIATYIDDSKFLMKLLLRSLNNCRFNIFRNVSQITTNTKSLIMHECEILNPPEIVRHMTVLDKSAFTKTITVPTLLIPKCHLPLALKKSKKYLLKLVKLNSVVEFNENDDTHKILLNPLLIKDEKDALTKGIDLHSMNGKFNSSEISITYENWKAEQILRAVLPEKEEGCSGFSIIGHILHLNLREHLYPYKNLIGQVYLDKVPNISMVVNKVDIIDNSDNSFRSFSMEKLAGDKDDTIVTVKENNCSYRFDFSKVYWNPRLSTEHYRVTSKLRCNDVFFDVMAGVGPFAIPAAKAGCQVFANDLNPYSFQALKDNCSLNKVTHNVQCFNMDGKIFIKDIIPKILKQKVCDGSFNGFIHITMNLPSIAVEFLPSFRALFSAEDVPKYFSQANEINTLPVIHLYLFSFNETKEYAVYKVASHLGYSLEEINVTDDIKSIDVEKLRSSVSPIFWDHILDVIEVRRVAPAKVMFRVSFHIPYDVFVSSSDSGLPVKKLKT